jgi:iron complex outermembrane receptor protein
MNNSLQAAVRAAARFILTASLCWLPLGAQTSVPAPNSETSPEPKKEKPEELGRFVVTGSYIPSTETAIEAGASPIVRVDRKEIEESGYTNTAELLQQITVSNANSVPISNNATGFTPGATAISLRGLGPEATLVLINGRRVAAYPVGAGGTTAFVDLNSIPLSAIETIEVLKDGASAVYGADAVAGVINIKLRRQLDGSEVFVSYGNTTEDDAAEVVASLASGVTKDKYNVVAGLNYYRKNGIMHHDRKYSVVPPRLSENSSPANLDLTRFAVANALNQTPQAPIAGVSNFDIFLYANSGATANNNGAKPATQYNYTQGRDSLFNFNEFSMSYPESERKGAFAFGEVKLFRTDNVKGYVDLNYQNVVTENQLAPTATGDFSTPGQTELVIPARTANPILTVYFPALGILQQVAAGTAIPRGWIPGLGTQIVNGTAQRLAPAGATNPFNPFNQDIADTSRARLVDFGNRITRDKTDAFMFTSGIKGENIAGKWNFDAAFSYSSIEEHRRARMVSATRFNQVVNANSPIFNPQSPAYIGTTTAYNPFGYYRNPIASNAAVVNYATAIVKDDDESTLGQLSVVMSTSELWKFPHGSVGFAAGADFRREQLDQDPDALAVGGDIIGESPRAITNAQRKIGGVFAEARVPLLRFVEATAAVRHEKFFTSHRDTTVPKFGLRVRPLGNQLTLRTSYSKGFREPSLYELYSSPVSALLPILDPRDGFVELEQPITIRGNRQLKAEKTDYFNAGFVWSPTAPRLKGLSLGVDRWEVTRRGTVEAQPQNTVYRFFGALPGGLLPGESVLLNTSGFISSVNSLFYNLGRTEVGGWDFSGGYQFPTDTLGRWEVTSVWTLTNKFRRAAFEGARMVDVAGEDATGTGDYGYLRWRGRVNLNWAYRGYNVYLSAHYTDGFADTDANGDPFGVAHTIIYDGQVSYNFRNTRGRWLRDTKLTVGMRNLLDRDPPLAIGGGGNTNGYPGFLYDSEGRFWYVSVSRKL